jgi:hypothetical protein
MTGRLRPQQDQKSFSTALRSSQLRRPDFWSALHVDELAHLCDTEITCIADGLVPIRTVRFIRRSSDPWFLDDCRAAKRCVRHPERDTSVTIPETVQIVEEVW